MTYKLGMTTNWKRYPHKIAVNLLRSKANFLFNQVTACTVQGKGTKSIRNMKSISGNRELPSEHGRELLKLNHPEAMGRRVMDCVLHFYLNLKTKAKKLDGN